MGPSNCALLAVEGLAAGYGRKRVLDDVGLTVGAGEAVALIGHNGAGKTTFLRTVFGLQPPWSGGVRFAGEHVSTRFSARAAVRSGMAMVPAEHFVFGDLPVRDNLRLSTRGLSGAQRAERLAFATDLFPVLGERGDQLAGTMSGGEQRMVSLAMALIPEPRLLLLDEPSLGLSPVLAEQIFTVVRHLVHGGMSVVLVEQNVPAALSVASRVYVLRSGRVILGERAEEFLARGRERWWELF